MVSESFPIAGLAEQLKLTEEGERRSVRDRPHDRHELQSPGVKKSVDVCIETEAMIP